MNTTTRIEPIVEDSAPIPAPTAVLPTSPLAFGHACRLARDAMRDRRGRAPRAVISTERLRAAFDPGLSERGHAPEDVLDELVRAATPGLMGNTTPDFFGWVMGASADVGVAADVLTSVWGQNAGIYPCSPSAAIAEEVVARWLLDLLRLPPDSSVGFVTGATMASFVGLAAARAEVLSRHGWTIEEEGLAGSPPIRVFIGEEAHSSVHSVLRHLGIGRRQLVRVEADEQGRLRVDRLAAAMSATDGPGIVVAQAGHINSGAFDPLRNIGEVVRERGAWLHVDGAFGLWARASERLRPLTDGAELADSWAIDGHKWLQVPYDSGYAIVRDAAAHRRAMSQSASYLNRETDDGRHPSDYVPELSRRARGFATWAVIRTLGREGLAAMIERHCDCARRLRELVATEPGIRVLNDVVLNQVALTFEAPHASLERLGTRQADAADARCNVDTTDAVIDAIQRRNDVFVSGADWRGCRVLRVSVIAEGTEARHVQRLADAIIDAWREVRGERSGPFSPLARDDEAA